MLLAVALVAGCGQLLDLEWSPKDNDAAASGAGDGGYGGAAPYTPGTMNGGGSSSPSSERTSESATTSATASSSAGAGGGGGSCSTPDDCPGDNLECRVRGCHAGSCIVLDLPQTQPCSAGVCDGMGHCVECNSNADCWSTKQCSAGLCVSCHDHEMNGSETDVDCGGPVCRKCHECERCLVNSDCRDGVCAGGTCDEDGSCTDDEGTP